MKVVLIVPTFNERENIDQLIGSLQGVFQTVRHDMHVLVADDRSPDGTGDYVRALQSRHQNLHLIEGPKAGLGAAYTRAMRHAVSDLQADVIFEMDADFSHNPSDVPRLLEQVERGYDFVIGSRYVGGGTVPSEWGWYRQLVSRGGNLVARHVAGIRHIKDCTGGFRAITRNIIDKLDWTAVQVQGYAFQVALLHAAIVAGAKVKEIPIHFADRARGTSKLGFSDIIEFVLNAWWIRFRRLTTFAKFAAVGLTGVAVNLGSFSLLLGAGLNKFLASPIAIELSIITNFLLNNFWTFRWRNTNDSVSVRGLKFNLVSLAALVISYTTFLFVVLLFPDWPPQVAQALAIPPAMILNYFLNSIWTFREAEA